MAQQVRPVFESLALIKKLIVAVHACNPSPREQGQDCWGLLASSLAKNKQPVGSVIGSLS